MLPPGWAPQGGMGTLKRDILNLLGDGECVFGGEGEKRRRDGWMDGGIVYF